jgi:hypothetical protein
MFVSLQKFFRRKTARDLLPIKPVEIAIEAWWVVQAGYITEDDIKVERPSKAKRRVLFCSFFYNF